MKILIAYDGSKYSETVLNDLAFAGIPSGSEIILFHVVEADQITLENEAIRELKHLITNGEALVKLTLDSCRKRYPEYTFWGKWGTGNPSTEILLMAQSNEVDLIMMGSHGRNAISRLFLGSVSLQVLKEAKCSVRISKEENKSVTEQRILLALDESQYSNKVVHAVEERSWSPNTVIRLLHVDDLMLIAELHGYAGEDVLSYKGSSSEMLTIMHNAVDKLTQLHFPVSSALRVGSTRYMIIEEAKQWDATQILVGAKGKGRIERLLTGSISQFVAIHAKATVEVVR